MCLLSSCKIDFQDERYRFVSVLERPPKNVHHSAKLHAAEGEELTICALVLQQTRIQYHVQVLTCCSCWSLRKRLRWAMSSAMQDIKITWFTASKRLLHWYPGLCAHSVSCIVALKRMNTPKNAGVLTVQVTTLKRKSSILYHQVTLFAAGESCFPYIFPL